MNRTLRELLAIASELKGVYAAYQLAAKDGKITADEGLALAGQALAVLVKHNVTVAELQELLTEVGPFLSLVK
jgi:hypothetical protein